jgi:hypothetical protein
MHGPSGGKRKKDVFFFHVLILMKERKREGELLGA